MLPQGLPSLFDLKVIVIWSSGKHLMIKNFNNLLIFEPTFVAILVSFKECC